DGGMNRWISGWRDGWMDMFYILKFLVIKFCSTQQLIYIVYLTKTHLFTHTHTHTHTHNTTHPPPHHTHTTQHTNTHTHTHQPKNLLNPHPPTTTLLITRCQCDLFSIFQNVTY